MFHSAVEIIVLRVGGEVDLCTVPIIQAAVDDALDQYPAHVVVDLARMTFCSVWGFDLFTRTRGIAAEKAIGYAVTGVLPQIDCIWTLGWNGDLPVSLPQHRSSHDRHPRTPSGRAQLNTAPLLQTLVAPFKTSTE